MTAAGTIRTRNLTVDYDTGDGVVRALEDTSLHVSGGTSVAVMGPSGCGKSTLLGLVGGLAVPTRGMVSIGETVISELPERARVRFRRRTIGMVYQADNLIPHLTVEENVGLQLAISRGGGGGDTPGRLLGRLGLGQFTRRLPDQLSGGQRQRVAVARAIIHRPAVILADEPTGALDADTATEVVELLFEVHREIGATLVMVTHDPAVAHHAARLVHLDAPEPEPIHAH